MPGSWTNRGRTPGAEFSWASLDLRFDRPEMLAEEDANANDVGMRDWGPRRDSKVIADVAFRAVAPQAWACIPSPMCRRAGRSLSS